MNDSVTPVRGPWEVIHNMCLRTTRKCLAVAKPRLRSDMTTHTRKHAVALILIADKLCDILDDLETWVTEPPSKAEWQETFSYAQRLQEDAAVVLRKLGEAL